MVTIDKHGLHLSPINSYRALLVGVVGLGISAVTAFSNIDAYQTRMESCREGTPVAQIIERDLTSKGENLDAFFEGIGRTQAYKDCYQLQHR